jgi:hypothetical protein
MAINPAAAVAMSAKRIGVMFLLPIFLKCRGLDIRSLLLLTAKN